ncbi:MAG: hypothetical protein RBU30_04835 [Polyangia bacterium]|nr:hypothetical protein [Polyangia bacterium]
MRRAEPTRDPQGGFGPPALFDLTTLERPRPTPPQVYYLVPEPKLTDRPVGWRTAVGFTAVVGGGLGLGLILALVLL